jgi:prevent-host-death family protein
MPEQYVSVTAAARGFSDLINRVRYRGESAVLVKNGVPVARVGPFTPTNTGSTAAVLADRLADLEVHADDADWFITQISAGRRWG